MNFSRNTVHLIGRTPSMPDVVTAVAGERRLSQLMAIDAGIHGNILLLP